MSDITGQRFGKYEARERLGRGGMADVYKAYQPGMDRFVALKVLHGHLAEAEDFIVRFRREAQSVGQLRHPHILNVIDFDIQNNVYYMVMEFISGGTLKDYIQEQSRLSAFETVRIALQLTDALSYAHQHGMVHRDIKPANIMFTDPTRRTSVLTDFGIARILDASSLTMSGAAVGTPAYMSPEAGKGETQDERSDLYSLGIVIYEMLAGSVPFSADTPYAIIVKHIQEPMPSLKNLQLPDNLERLILKSTAKNPQERYQSAQELREHLLALQPQVNQKVISIDETAATLADDPPTMVGSDEKTVLQTAHTVLPAPPKPSFLPWVLAILLLLFLGVVFFMQSGDDPVAQITAPTSEVEVATSEAEVATSEAEVATSEVEYTTFEELSPEAQACFTQGEQAASENDFEAAAEAFSCVVELAPTFAEGYLQRANAYAYFDGAAAIQDLLKALDFRPDDPEIYYSLGGLNRSMEDFETAIDYYTRAFEAGKDDYSYLFAARGEIYFWQGEYEAAIADYERAIEMDEAVGDFHLMLAKIYLEMGQSAEALPYLEQAESLPDTDPAELAYAKGLAARQVGELQDAVILFRDAIALSPEEWNYHRLLAETYMEQGHYEAVLEFSTKAIEFSPQDDPHLYYLRGYANLLLKRYQPARNDMDYAIGLDESIGEFYAGRGETYAGQNRFEEARADYEQALELGYDQNPQVFFHLAQAYDALDNADQALETFRLGVLLAEKVGEEVPQSILDRIQTLERDS